MRKPIIMINLKHTHASYAPFGTVSSLFALSTPLLGKYIHTSSTFRADNNTESGSNSNTHGITPGAYDPNLYNPAVPGEGYISNDHIELMDKVACADNVREAIIAGNDLKEYIERVKPELGDVHYKAIHDNVTKFVRESIRDVYEEQVEERDTTASQSDSNKRKIDEVSDASTAEQNTATQQNKKASLLDDYADTSLEQPSYMDCDD